MFEYEKEILKEVAEEQDVPYEHVEEIWKYTLNKISGWLDDPMAPKVLINGFMTLRPDIPYIEKRIFVNLHKLRFSYNKDYRNTLTANIDRFMKIRRRLKDERGDN